MSANIMSHLKLKDFLHHYTHAATKEQEAVVILDAFHQIEQEQLQRFAQHKEEVLNEIHIEDLATKTDLAETKFSIIKWLGGMLFVGIWLPIAIAVCSKYFGLL